MDNSETVKINFDELQALIDCIQNNKSKIFDGYGKFLTSLERLRNSGLIEGSAYRALVAQGGKISELGYNFDVYTTSLINNLKKILETQQQTEQTAEQEYEELLAIDPTQYNGGISAPDIAPPPPADIDFSQIK